MPILNGIEAAREIQRVSPKTKTVTAEHAHGRPVHPGGPASESQGFILKTHAAEDPGSGRSERQHGETYLSPEISEAVLKAYQGKSEIPEDPLSARERNVLQLIAEGKSTKEGHSALDISVKTAETYRTRIMEKLDIHNIASLVRYAVRCGLVQP